MAPLKFCFLLLILFSSTVFSQKIYGKVEDAKKKPVSKVQIKLETYEQHRTQLPIFTTTTNKEGEFSFVDIPANTYRISASKKGWINWKSHVVVKPENKETKVNIVLELTTLYKILTLVQFGSVLYILFFGLIILGLNFVIVGEKGKELAILGWGFILLSVVVAFYKWKFWDALQFAILSFLISFFVHKKGNKHFLLKWEEEKEVIAELEDSKKREKEKLESWVGKEAMTSSALRPYGMICIDDKMLEAKTRQGTIPKDSKIRVIAVEGNTFIVEAME